MRASDARAGGDAAAGVSVERLGAGAGSSKQYKRRPDDPEEELLDESPGPSVADGDVASAMLGFLSFSLVYLFRSILEAPRQRRPPSSTGRSLFAAIGYLPEDHITARQDR